MKQRRKARKTAKRKPRFIPRPDVEKAVTIAPDPINPVYLNILLVAGAAIGAMTFFLGA